MTPLSDAAEELYAAREDQVILAKQKQEIMDLLEASNPNLMARLRQIEAEITRANQAEKDCKASFVNEVSKLASLQDDPFSAPPPHPNVKIVHAAKVVVNDPLVTASWLQRNHMSEVLKFDFTTAHRDIIRHFINTGALREEFSPNGETLPFWVDEKSFQVKVDSHDRWKY